WLCGSVARRRVAGGSLSVYPGADGRQCRVAARFALRGITGRSARAPARADWLCSVVRYLLSRYSLCWLAAAVGGCAVSDGVGSRRWHPANDRARLGLCPGIFAMGGVLPLAIVLCWLRDRPGTVL